MTNKTPKVKIGDRFGKLVVLEQIEMPIMKTIKDEFGNSKKVPSGRTKVGWRCQCDCGEEAKIPQDTLLKETSVIRSCGKCPPEKNENFVSKSMSYEEQQEWDELYEYVRTNIMGYSKDQSLSKQMVARLQGLMKGKYMVNNKTVNNANYSFKTILNTYKFCSVDIRKALGYKTFDSEWIKFSYIAKIVENNINTVYVRERRAEQAREEIKKIEINTPVHTGVEYKPREKKTKNKFKDLW